MFVLLSSISILFLLIPICSSFCDLNCHFKHPSISSETIKKWPKNCDTVCGNIIINGSTVTESELADNFYKLKALEGNIQIENTNFTSLNFLETLEKFLCGADQFVLANNSKLVDVSLLNWWSSESECIWKIINNPKVDLDDFCDGSDEYRLRPLKTYGNLRGCECVNVIIDFETLPHYTNCTSITGNLQGVLKITNVSDSDNLSGLKRLKVVTGNIEIVNTSLTNLSFLGGLESLIGEPMNVFNMTRIYGNPNLTRLGWDSLKKITPNEYPYPLHTMEIRQNHPDFCLTTYELQIFAQSLVDLFSNFEAKICADAERKDGQKICRLESLASLHSTCQHVIGDLIVNSDNEKEAWRLENMTNLYGSLTVEGTKELVDLGFLRNLKTVASLTKDGPQLIRILSNKMLQNVTLAKMKSTPFPRIFGASIQVSGNSMPIFPTRKECLLFQKQIRSYVKYNGFSCKKLPVAEGETSDGNDYYEGAEREEDENVEGSGGGKVEKGGSLNFDIWWICIVIFWRFL